MDTLGKRMRFAREAKGLTLEQVGNACGGKSIQAVRKWEMGTSTPNPYDLWTIVGLTGVNPGWLILGVGSRYPEQGRQESRGRRVPNVPLQEVPAYLSNDEYKPLYYSHTKNPCGPRSFVIVVEDIANDPLIPRGAIVVIDPDRTPQPGEFVLGLVDGKAVLRKFHERSDHVELVPHKEAHKEYRVDTDLSKWLIGTLSEVTHDARPV